MATELNELSPTTIELLSAYFNSSRGAAAVAADADLDPEVRPVCMYVHVPACLHD